MLRRTVIFSLMCFCGTVAFAQDFTVFNRNVQVHGFMGQGIAYTDTNNWLTMQSSDASVAYSDFGVNISSQITDKFHVGAQMFNRNMGQLGNWHPQLDWAVADYRFTKWLGVRGGKVKTTLGLYTDTQDLDFLHTFALLPQGVYPVDTRDSTIAHLGGDVYGDIEAGEKGGTLSYTVYVGHRNDSMESGYAHFLQARGTSEERYGGTQYGADLRWQTPLKGLLIGASYLNEDNLSGFGIRAGLPNHEKTKTQFTNQFFGSYSWRNLRLDAEYKHWYRDVLIRNLTAEDLDDVHAFYIAGSYRLMKWLELGSYYSHYTITSTFLGLQDTSLPSGHNYDTAVTARVDINRFWVVKIEGHFMDGYGYGPYPNGFYPQENPNGFQPNTNALIVKTSFYF